jgi:hypothetical protein
VRSVKGGGTRTFYYEGRFTNGQLILFFEDVEGRDVIVGTMVLRVSADLSTLVGRSTYVDLDAQNRPVVSSAREYRKCTSSPKRSNGRRKNGN